VLYNTIASAVLQIITIISILILPRLILVTYGSSINGLIASLTQFVGYLYIFETGLSTAVIYALYKPLAEKNYDVINGIISATKRAYKQVGLFFIGLLVVLTITYPLIINAEHIDLSTVVFLTLSIGATGIINYFLIGKYSVILTASQSVYILSIARIVYIVVNTSIMIIFIKLKFNIALVYFISLTANLLNAYIISTYSKKKFNYLNFNEAPITSALSKRYDVVFHQISGMIVTNVPVLFLTIFSDLKTVSVYSIYSIIFLGISMILGIFGNSFTATFGELIAIKENGILKESYSQYEFIYYGMLAFTYSCVLILGISFIELYTKGITDASYIDYGTLLLFTLVGVLNNWKTPQNTIIIAAGHFKQTRHRAIIEALLTILVSIPLVIYFDLKGVLIGSSIGLIYRSIDIIYAQKITDFQFKYTFSRILRFLIIIFLTVIPCKTIFIFEPNNVLTWLLYAMTVAVWVGVVVILTNFIFERSTFLNISLRIKNIINFDKYKPRKLDMK